MSVMVLLVVSSAGFVMPSPKCHPRMGGSGSLRETVPQNEEPTLEDPTTKELFGVVTRAELSLGISDLRGVIERQSGDLRVLAEQLKSSSEKQSVEIERLAKDLSKDITELSDKVTKLVPEVEKFGKVATEFDLYKGGAQVFVGALVATVIAYVVNKK